MTDPDLDPGVVNVVPGTEVTALQAAYGTLQGGTLETAELVFVAQERMQADSDANQARGYTGN